MWRTLLPLGTASHLLPFENETFLSRFFFVLFCCIANRPKWVGEWSKQKVFLVVLKYVPCTYFPLSVVGFFLMIDEF